MLQQTQVATVLNRFYYPFLKQFPTLQALAEAPLQEVLKAWEGLGYYSRARNLHRSAQLAAPALPDTIDALMALPGIGRNTAHAIAAFAFRQPVAVMEANVRRILHRLAAHETMSVTEQWEMATALVDKEDSFTYNQAMMDIGALVCTPKAPDCAACPLSPSCSGKDNPEYYPAKEQRKAIPIRPVTLIIARDTDGRLLLEARSGSLLGGLYGFPQLDAGDTIFFLSERAFPVSGMTHLGNIHQIYSHFRLEAEVKLLQLDTGMADWFPLQAIADLPLSGVDRKALQRYVAGEDCATSGRSTRLRGNTIAMKI